MNKLNELNKYIYEEYKQLPNREELSIPLLISSNDDYTNNLERRVLYIGQETNCWMNNRVAECARLGYRRAIVPFIPSLKNFDGIEVHFVKYLRDAFLLLGEADANSR